MSRSLAALLLLNALIAILYTYFSFGFYKGYALNITPWQIVIFSNHIGEMQGLVVFDNYLYLLFTVSIAINIAYVMWINRKTAKAQKQ
jgi:hypothetical protein